MAAIKITKFSGTSPKRAPELLAENAAQIARNCKVYSGNLEPYPQPVPAGTVTLPQIFGAHSTARTIYPLRNPATSVLEWRAWTTDVDIAVATSSEDDDQRFYYTGDGVPKVSNYEISPAAFDLGLPLPPNLTRLTATPTPAEEMVVNTYSRDAGNTARLVVNDPHNLRTGALVTITGFSAIYGAYTQAGLIITVDTPSEAFAGGAKPHGLSSGASVILTFTSGDATSGVYTVETVISDFSFTVSAPNSANTSGLVQLSLRAFNASNVEVTVLDPTTFEYFNPGPATSPLTTQTARVNLSGLTQARSYVFTWLTPWDEESIASKPSEEIFIKEGQIVTLSGIPIQRPSGNNYIRGMRLYRTLPSLSGTEYFLLNTLWFPIFLATVSRNQDVSRVTTMRDFPHNLSIDDVFRIDECETASFNIVDGVVTDVIDPWTFEYAQEGAFLPETASWGVIWQDVSEDPGVTEARYWHHAGNFDFVDDFNSKLLLDGLETDEYEPPPKNLQGLIQTGNNILAGFVGNELFFSEPNRPHAWPRSYSVVLEYDIVAIAAIAGSVLVTTESYPYTVSVTDPAAGTAVTRVDVQYPCLNRKSMVTLPYGIAYATHGGLALFSPFGGAQIITKEVHHSDTWNEQLDPTTLVASFYNDGYLASHSSGGLFFERDEQSGGMFVDLDATFSAVWYDALTNRLYFTRAGEDTVYEWNAVGQQPQTQIWKSKVIKTPDMLNLGAARVLADHGDPSPRWGSIGTTWNQTYVNWNMAGNVVFKLWADRQLIATVNLNDNMVFRLPTGYRTDTFEVAVESNVRIEAIHLAETPLGLKVI